LAVKIVRQAKHVALLGAPTSAANLVAGHERAPQALRAAGLVARLTSAGFQVTDHGDCVLRVFAADDEHPRARNTAAVLATLEELRPKVEVAVKSGALPIILGGDSTIVLATIAGARRYYHNVSLIYVDRDAALNVPATTPSGCVDGMVISHVLGRGAPELVRFWGEPPLVREPDVALFGLERLDPPEQQFLARSALRRYTVDDIVRRGPKATAEETVDRVHARRHDFVLHIDLDVIAAEDFRAANLSAPGGLRLADLRQALAVFAAEPKLAAIEISAYNPALDPDGSDAKRIIDLLLELLAPRLKAETAAQPEAAGAPEAAAAPVGGDENPPAPLDVPAESAPASEPAREMVAAASSEPASAAPESAPAEETPEAGPSAG
jgi:arginase